MLIHLPTNKSGKKFQIQFSSRRLGRDMFKVVNGIVSGIEHKMRGLLSERTYDEGPDIRDLKPLNPNGYM